MELQTILEEERESIRSRFTAAESAPEAKEAFTKALEKLLYRYTEETKEEALKTAASHMFAAAKASAALFDTAGEAKIWEREREGVPEEPAKKVSVPGIIFLFAGIACLLAALLTFYPAYPELTTRSGWQLPGGLPLGAFLSLFLCGLLIRPKKKPAPDSKERKASFRTDPEKCMRALTAVVLTIDGQLKEAEAEEKARLRRAEMEQPPFEEAELDLFAALLEAQAAGDGEYALEKAEDLKYLLHTKDVETVDFSAEHSDWFEKMPGDLPGTIRPAFVRRGKLLRKGLFAGEL